MKINWGTVVFDLCVVAMFSYAVLIQHRNPWPWAALACILFAGSGSYEMKS